MDGLSLIVVVGVYLLIAYIILYTLWSIHPYIVLYPLAVIVVLAEDLLGVTIIPKNTATSSGELGGTANAHRSTVCGSCEHWTPLKNDNRNGYCAENKKVYPDDNKCQLVVK